jgi:hypothetical protein
MPVRSLEYDFDPETIFEMKNALSRKRQSPSANGALKYLSALKKNVTHTCRVPIRIFQLTRTVQRLDPPYRLGCHVGDLDSATNLL